MRLLAGSLFDFDRTLRIRQSAISKPAMDIMEKTINGSCIQQLLLDITASISLLERKSFRPIRARMADNTRFAREAILDEFTSSADHDVFANSSNSWFDSK